MLPPLPRGAPRRTRSRAPGPQPGRFYAASAVTPQLKVGHADGARAEPALLTAAPSSGAYAASAVTPQLKVGHADGARAEPALLTAAPSSGAYGVGSGATRRTNTCRIDQARKTAT